MLVLVLMLAPMVASAETPKPASPNTGKKVIVDRVAAIVNDSVILISELDLRMLPLRNEAMQIKDQGERERRLVKLALQVLDEMVNDELMVQAASEAKITVDQAEMQQSIDYIKQQNGLDDKQLAEAMKAQGMTLATLRNDVVRQRAINQLVGPKVQITAEDVRARYDQLQRRSEAVSAVSLSQIVFALPEHPTVQQLKEAKANAQKSLDRVKAGEDFTKVANEVTEDPTTKATGGQLGWIQRGTLAENFDQVVFSMEKGDIRGPVKGAKGLYVLQVTDVKRSELKPFDAMKDELTAELRRKALAKHTQAWIEELRKKAYIDIKLK